MANSAGRFIVGFGRDDSGPHTIECIGSDNRREKLTFELAQRVYETSVVTGLSKAQPEKGDLPDDPEIIIKKGTTAFIGNSTILQQVISQQAKMKDEALKKVSTLDSYAQPFQSRVTNWRVTSHWGKMR